MYGNRMEFKVMYQIDIKKEQRYNVLPINIKTFSAIPSEDEILFPPLSFLKIVKLEEKTGYTEINLEYVDAEMPSSSASFHKLKSNSY